MVEPTRTEEGYVNGYLIYTCTRCKDQKKFMLGDVNHDKKVDSSDAVLILRYLAGYEDEKFHKEIADFNRDGKVDSSDAVAILRFLAGYDDW